MSGEAVALFCEAFYQELRCGVYLHQGVNLEILRGCPRILELIRLKG